MFTLNPLQIAQFNVANAARFVDFWSQFYNDGTTVTGTEDLIDYFAELNVGNDLTEENVRRLLRWKDARQLTHRILSGPDAEQDNPRVVKVVNNLAMLNCFRRNQLTEDEARNAAREVFPNGIVFQVFLLHIAKPHTYPIADQHVFRAFALHKGRQAKENWETYVAYRNYFAEIAEAMGIAQTVGTIHELKRIDNALMVFGQFLKAYYRR